MGQTWVDVGWLKAEREGGEVAVPCHLGMLAAAKCGKFCLRFVCDPTMAVGNASHRMRRRCHGHAIFVRCACLKQTDGRRTYETDLITRQAELDS